MKVQIATAHERIVALDTRLSDKVQATHTRIDKLEVLIREDFVELKEDVKAIVTKMDSIAAWSERSKGWAAAALLLATVLGGVIVKTVSIVLK